MNVYVRAAIGCLGILTTSYAPTVVTLSLMPFMGYLSEGVWVVIISSWLCWIMTVAAIIVLTVKPTTLKRVLSNPVGEGSS